MIDDLFLIRLRKEVETKRRIYISICAYAYEILNNPIVSDADYDRIATEVDLSIDTSRPDLDDWFRKNYQPHTGMWIHNHPELDKLKRLYNDYYNRKN